VTKKAGVGDEDSDEEVEDQGSGPSGDVVGTQSEIGVLLVRLDGFGSQEKEDPDTRDRISTGRYSETLCVLPCALNSSV
jgi:hypothetical protein